MDAAQCDEMAGREVVIRLGEAPPFLEEVSELTKTVGHCSKRSSIAEMCKVLFMTDPDSATPTIVLDLLHNDYCLGLLQ